MTQPLLISQVRHPEYNSDWVDWEKWRLTWEGGSDFLYRYLTKFTDRESDTDFQKRKQITPIPTFAKAAVNDIKNSIYQRMVDITRSGGSPTFQSAIAGENGGVNRKGGSMNAFIGQDVLPELLVMGKVGVFVDNQPIKGPTLAHTASAQPYIYHYKREDILSWECTRPEDPSEFQSVLLRDWCMGYEQGYPGLKLPNDYWERYRLVWLNPETGLVNYQFLNHHGEQVDAEGNPFPVGPIELKLTRIPFVMFDIGQSLLKDICQYQIALLNLASSDIAYALKSNFPFYVEQQDVRASGSHLKSAIMNDGTAATGGQEAGVKEIKVGGRDGRIYSPGMDRPDFIHPSPEPLKASMDLQAKLESDIRKLVNLAVVSLGSSRASGEAKRIDNQGLAAGLSFIGLVLESGERKVADYWAAYESANSRSRQIATISYPDTYDLRSDEDRIATAEKLTDLVFKIPGRTVKKEIAKLAAESLLGSKIGSDRMRKINSEIDTAKYSTSSPEIVELAQDKGLADNKTLSESLGYDAEYVVPLAEEDHARRLKRLMETQGLENGNKPAARGLPDADPNPNSGREEREAATNTDTKPTTESRVRGKGKDNNE